MDVGNDVNLDGICTNVAARGNLMDFFAMSMPGATVTNAPWYFAWTVDSSQPLNDTTGSFFGYAGPTRVNYIIGIEVGCAGAPRLEMWENGQPWEREFAWNVHYFIAMYDTGPDTMEAQLWRNDGANSRSMIVGGIPVTSIVVGFRRQLEFALPATAPVPVELRNNSQLCFYMVSVENIDRSGRVLDAVGQFNHNINCPGPALDLTTLGAIFIDSQPNCKAGGRPTDPGVNDRQCLSYPRRDTVENVNVQSCLTPPGL